MSQKLIESVDINKLISADINDFIPTATDFGQIVVCYVNSLESIILQTDTNYTITEFLDHKAVCWILPVKSPEDKVKVLFRRLVASVVLKISDFSNVLLEQCRKFVAGDELKDALKRIAYHADLFEALRANYKNVLERQITLVTKTSNLGQPNNSGSQNLPKYWITTKSPEGWRRVIYLDKKNSNGEYTVKIGGAEYIHDFGPNAIPFFDSLKQAEDFIVNIQLGKSSTRRPLNYINTFNFKIVDISDKKYNKVLYKQNLQNYILVKTACGEAYINKNASCY